MNNRNSNVEELNNSIRILFALFFTIVLSNGMTRQLDTGWLMMMGVIIIILSLLALVLPTKKEGTLKDRTEV